MNIPALLGARLTMLLHFGFLLFVLFGALLCLRQPGLVWLHLPLVAWGVVVMAMRWDCPLTLLENRLLRRAGRPTYELGFIDYYLAARFFPTGMPRPAQLALVLLLLLVNVGTYGWLLLGRGHGV